MDRETGEVEGPEPSLYGPVNLEGSADARAALVKKLAGALAKVGAVPRNGWNEHDRYKYARATDIADYVRTAMLEAGLLCLYSVKDRSSTPSQTAAGKPAMIENLVLGFCVTDGSAALHYTIVTCAKDHSDKAVFKALTGGWKYGLINVGMLATDDDPESEGANGNGNGNGQKHAAQERKPDPAPPGKSEPPPPKKAEPSAPQKRKAAATEGSGGPIEDPTDQECEYAETWEQHPATCTVCRTITFGERHKGKTLCKLDDNSLVFYRGLALKWVKDPGKERYLDDNRALLKAIESEMAGRGSRYLLSHLDIPF